MKLHMLIMHGHSRMPASTLEEPANQETSNSIDTEIISKENK